MVELSRSSRSARRTAGGTQSSNEEEMDRRYSNEGDDKDNSRGQERWNHDDAKPSNVKAVVGRRNEGSKSSPNE